MRSTMALVLMLAAASLFGGGDARADVAPPDACQSVGQPCTNAGPSYNSPGVCTATTCSRGQPDGGSTSYACMLCEPTDSGASTADGGGADGGPAGGGSKSSSGCAMSPLQREGATGFAMLALGVGALVWGRRRRP